MSQLFVVFHFPFPGLDSIEFGLVSIRKLFFWLELGEGGGLVFREVLFEKLVFDAFDF